MPSALIIANEDVGVKPLSTILHYGTLFKPKNDSLSVDDGAPTSVSIL